MKPAAQFQISKVLPLAARQRLVDAAAVDPGAEPGCSFERMRAVDIAVRWAQVMYPHFFQR